MRIVLVTLIILISLPFCFYSPYFGVLMWCWIATFQPMAFAWYGVPFQIGELVGLATLIGLVFSFHKFKLFGSKQIYLIAALWIWIFLSTVMAVHPYFAWDKCAQYSKIFVFSFLILGLVNSPKKLRYLLLVMVLSLGFIGAKAGLIIPLRGGKVTGYSGMFGGENDFALVINMMIPLLYYFAIVEKGKSFKLLLFSMFIFCIPAVIFTYSRGGFLGLIVALSLIILRSKKKSFVLLALILIGLFILIRPPKGYIERIETIKTYQEDGSAMGRIDAWKVAFKLITEKPIFGVGPRNFSLFNPSGKDAHNSFVQMMVESGIPALLFFLGLISLTILDLRKIRWQMKLTDRSNWIFSYSHMLEISLIVFMIEGNFLNRQDLEVLYYLISASVVLIYLACRAEEEPGNEIVNEF